MAEGDDPRPPGWDEPPIPLRAARGGGFFRKLSIGNLMLALIYFALVFWVLRNVVETDSAIQSVLLGVLVGLGIAALGLWAAMRLTRFSFLGWIVFVIGYMTFTIATVTFFALPSLPILIGAIVTLTIRRRRTQQDALLWVLDVAADRGMPLAPGIQAFSGQTSGIYKVWARSLATLLREGVSLPEAIESLPKLVPRSSALLIRMGQESGDLSSGLGEATRARTGRSTVTAGLGARLAYLGCVISIGLGIHGFVLYFIIPKFEAIFRDFGVSFPQATIYVIRASHALIEYSWILPPTALACLTALPFVFWGWSDLGLPLVDRLFSGRHTYLILRALAVVIDAGRPIGPALRSMAEWYPRSWVRKRLGAASLYADQGVDWAEALHSCGLITGADAGVLDAASRAGNLPWALRELADSGDRRRAYRLQAWSQVLFVLAMLVLGFVVFTIAAAYFLPLITLIQRLAQ